MRYMFVQKARTSSPKIRSRHGFTLVEVLIVSPAVILVVALIVGFMVGMTTDALVARERNALIHTTQTALDQIEQDVRLATKISSTTGALIAPQGSDSSTAAFNSGSSVLVLEQYATSRHPSNPQRSLLFHRNQPNPCGALQSRNTPLRHMAVYFVRDSTLFKRTIVTFADNQVCGPTANGSAITTESSDVWQRNSCTTAAASGRCLTTDTIIARNVSSVQFQYYADNSFAATQASPTDSTMSVRTTINTARQIAGSTGTFSGSAVATRIQ